MRWLPCRDQTGQSIFPCPKDTYAAEGVKQVSLLGMDEKRQVTVVLGASMEGEILPAQVIFKGKTMLSLPPAAARKCMEEEGHKFAVTDTHWSTLDSMKEYVTHILGPNFMKKKEEMKEELGQNWEQFPAIGICDCWKVGSPTRPFLCLPYPWIMPL